MTAKKPARPLVADVRTLLAEMRRRQRRFERAARSSARRGDYDDALMHQYAADAAETLACDIETGYGINLRGFYVDAPRNRRGK
jgi:hypothetical protein